MNAEIRNKEILSLKTFLAGIHEKHEYINWGGCCVFAGILGKHLAEVGKVRVRVINSVYGSSSNIDQVRKKIRKNESTEWNRHGIGFNHVVVEFAYKRRKYAMDSEGIRVLTPDLDKRYVEGALTVKEAQELGSTQRGWNPMFDRGEIPAIRSKVQRYFKKFIQDGKLTS